MRLCSILLRCGNAVCYNSVAVSFEGVVVGEDVMVCRLRFACEARSDDVRKNCCSVFFSCWVSLFCAFLNNKSVL